jgi:hypothetical protein
MIKANKLRLCALSLCAAIFFSGGPSWADWKADVGYTRLAVELGAAIPDGGGVIATQVEAGVTVGETDTWMPDPNNAAFSGKTFTFGSGQTPGIYSGHATSVGQIFYGSASMAPGIAAIDAFGANYWLQSDFLRIDTALQPDVTASRVANHSWVGNYSGDYAYLNADILRRLDWVIATDEFIQTAANCLGSSGLLGSAFNAIAVGRTSGEGGSGSVAIDNIYTGGRTRPDLVAPRSNLSYATPVVTAAAILVVDLA